MKYLCNDKVYDSMVELVKHNDVLEDTCYVYDCKETKLNFKKVVSEECVNAVLSLLNNTLWAEYNRPLEKTDENQTQMEIQLRTFIDAIYPPDEPFYEGVDQLRYEDILASLHQELNNGEV